MHLTLMTVVARGIGDGGEEFWSEMSVIFRSLQNKGATREEYFRLEET